MSASGIRRGGNTGILQHGQGLPAAFHAGLVATVDEGLLAQAIRFRRIAVGAGGEPASQVGISEYQFRYGELFCILLRVRCAHRRFRQVWRILGDCSRASDCVLGCGVLDCVRNFHTSMPGRKMTEMEPSGSKITLSAAAIAALRQGNKIEAIKTCATRAIWT